MQLEQCDALFAVLAERANDGRWQITMDELERLLGTGDHVAFYRTAYKAGVAGHMKFNEASAGELVTLLETLGCGDAAARMRKAYLRIDHEDQIELTATLTRVWAAAVVRHTPRIKEFEQMLSVLRTYTRAYSTYCETYFDPQELINDASEAWLEGDLRAPKQAGKRLAEEYLWRVTRRGLVGLDTIAPALVDLLRAVARNAGYLPQLDEEASGGPRKSTRGRSRRTEPDRATEDRAAALRILGMHSYPPEEGQLKRRYRELMRRFHPDLNPAGLEKAKRITWAYGVLSASLSAW